MKLSDKQYLFAQTMTRFEAWLDRQGYKWVRGEAFRSPHECRRLAELGLGIVNSTHGKKLAQDLFIFDEHGNPWNDDVYRVCAEKWITMHPLARAGYFFKKRKGSPGRDGPHFSFIHNGVQ